LRIVKSIAVFIRPTHRNLTSLCPQIFCIILLPSSNIRENAGGLSIVKLGISIPTYNEAKNIKQLLNTIKVETADLKDVTIDLVVVDDRSPDGTGEIVNKLAKTLSSKNFNIILLPRPVKNGFGKACIAGFKYLLKDGVDYVLQMDADLSHNPVYIPAFVSAAENGSDFVIGSRYINGGETPDWSWDRHFLSHYGNLYIRAFLSSEISDYTGGYNLYSARLLRHIGLDSIRATGYGFLIEIKYRASLQAGKITQIPIVFTDRLHGKSKIPKNTLFKNLILAPKLRASKIEGRVSHE
jgi:dolichol-phosphate mannosyltransferase